MLLKYFSAIIKYFQYTGSEAHIEQLVRSHAPPPPGQAASKPGAGGTPGFRDVYKVTVCNNLYSDNNYCSHQNPPPFPALDTSQHTPDWLGHHGAQMVTIASSVQVCGIKRTLITSSYNFWKFSSVSSTGSCSFCGSPGGENCNSIYDEALISYFKTR